MGRRRKGKLSSKGGRSTSQTRSEQQSRQQQDQPRQRHQGQPQQSQLQEQPQQSQHRGQSQQTQFQQEQQDQSQQPHQSQPQQPQPQVLQELLLPIPQPSKERPTLRPFSRRLTADQPQGSQHQAQPQRYRLRAQPQHWPFGRPPQQIQLQQQQDQSQQQQLQVLHDQLLPLGQTWRQRPILGQPVPRTITADQPQELQHQAQPQHWQYEGQPQQYQLGGQPQQWQHLGQPQQWQHLGQPQHWPQLPQPWQQLSIPRQSFPGPITADQPQQLQYQGQPPQWQHQGQPQHWPLGGQSQLIQLQQQQLDQHQQPHQSQTQQPRYQSQLPLSQLEHTQQYLRVELLQEQALQSSQTQTGQYQIQPPSLPTASSSSYPYQAVQESTREQIKVGEAASTMQLPSLTQPSSRPITTDQPQQLQYQGQPPQWQHQGQPQHWPLGGQSQLIQLQQQQQDQRQQPHQSQTQQPRYQSQLPLPQLEHPQPVQYVRFQLLQEQALESSQTQTGQYQIQSPSLEQPGHLLKEWVSTQGRRKIQRSPTTSSSSSPYQTVQESTREQIKVGEAASTMQQPTLTPPSSGLITTAGDAPPQLLPQISGIKRRGGTNCKLRTRVLTNHFPLNIGKLKNAIHYDVVIAPDRPKNLFRTIIEEFRKLRFPNRHPAYDGNKNLYSSSPLFDGSEISDSVSIKGFDPNKPYEVTIKFATYVDLACLQNYVERVNRKSVLEMGKPMQALQCLDIVLRSAPGVSCIPVGRSYFTRSPEPFKLGDGGCVLYSGFYQSAIINWKPFVNVDVTHKAFTTALKMIDLVRDTFGEIDKNRELLPNQCEAINRHMKQLKVEYEVNGESNIRRICTVNELGPTPKRATFTENGITMTVEQYFKERNKKTLKYPNLPTLWVGSRTRENKILLPFEFCKIVADQEVNKKMTEEQTRNMIREAATANTDKRLENIKKSVASANYNKCATVQEFGISVDANPQDVEARVLHPPTVQYNKDITESVTKGVWRGTKFSEGATLSSWTILCLDYRTRDENIGKLIDDLMSQARNLGMSISEPHRPIHRLAEENLKESLRKYFSQSKCDMIIVILNNKNDCYNYVKQASEITVGCLTQCLKPATVYKPKSSTIGNILLKINAKLNGENHRIKELPMFLERPCMIMGADVTHPGPESRDFPSIAAVTASFDTGYFKYIFEWRLQQSREEMIVGLQEITKQHLLNYCQKNSGTKPERIIYVRDGVSDGQFVQVLNVELQAIRDACQNLDDNYKPGVIFVIVQKRHHTRFFPKDPSISEDINLNVPAGTCVDTEITHPSLTDFYLVSHASVRGVTKPTKYVKLWDDFDVSEDYIEHLMYYLCHMFARCNRSVSYPAPTYYAHLAAARARVYCEIDKIDMKNLPKEQQRLTIKENISKDMPMFFV